MLAAAVVTYSGEFQLMYVNPTGSNIWAVHNHTERMDLSDRDYGGFCSVAVSDSRALAIDRRGNLLGMDFIIV
jgi:hypothetical protein